jgi:N-acetylglucosamine-6-sulfatase
LDETNTPFFAMIAPPAPHAPFEAAARHAQAFENVTAPRTENFNIPSGPLDKHWLLTMLPGTLPADVINSLDLIYRKRWQTLLAVDEMVENIISHIGRKNMLENTYIIFTSDNGYHIGEIATNHW